MNADALPAVQAVLAQITGIHPESITESSPVSGLGLDSLDRVILAVRLEEVHGRAISDRALLDARTVADLAALLTPSQAPR